MSKGDAEVQTLYQLMVSKNHPLSVNDLIAYLTSHKMGKTSVQRALDSLVAEAKVIEKAYGKQKVYWASQRDLTESTPQELKDLDAKIASLEKQVQEAKSTNKGLITQQHVLSAAIKTEDAKIKCDKLQAQLETLKRKEAEVVVGELPDENKIKSIRDQRKKNLTEFTKLKRKGTEMLSTLMDSFPNSEAALREEIGVEQEEI